MGGGVQEGERERERKGSRRKKGSRIECMTERGEEYASL